MSCMLLRVIRRWVKVTFLNSCWSFMCVWRNVQSAILSKPAIQIDVSWMSACVFFFIFYTLTTCIVPCLFNMNLFGVMHTTFNEAEARFQSQWTCNTKSNIQIYLLYFMKSNWLSLFSSTHRNDIGDHLFRLCGIISTSFLKQTHFFMAYNTRLRPLWPPTHIWMYHLWHYLKHPRSVDLL